MKICDIKRCQIGWKKLKKNKGFFRKLEINKPKTLKNFWQNRENKYNIVVTKNTLFKIKSICDNLKNF